MTAPVDLDRLDALLAAASALPWHHNGAWPRWVDDEDDQPIAETTVARDAAAIVAAVNAAPLLIAELRELRAIKVRVEAHAHYMRSTHQPIGVQLAGDDLHAALGTGA